jgi:hypothetical protein
MTRDKAIQKAIDDEMDFFDIERVEKVMKYLNWTWKDDTETPSQYELRQEMRRLMKLAVKHKNIGTGGFEFSFHEIKDEGGKNHVWFSGGFNIASLTLESFEYTEQ